MEELTSIDFEILTLFQKKKRLHQDEIISSLPHEKDTLLFRIDLLSRVEREYRTPFAIPNTSYILAEYNEIGEGIRSTYVATGYYTLTAKGDLALHGYQKELKEKKRLEFIRTYQFWLPFGVSVLALVMSAIALYLSWIK